ncbi:MAG: glycosyltransferase family A protein [Candidatus Izemoplasmatales bacterium]|nr:glycosyltransferase family A protein [Candidatus Portnoybacteria bacterium]
MPDPVTIVMTTWFVSLERMKIAEQTLKSWNDKLVYEGDILLHVADDGSDLEWKPEKFWKRSEITYSRQERQGVGASLNAGFNKAYETSPYVLYMVDDWRLNTPFDITPWAYVLKTRRDIGVVRLGPPHPFTEGRIEPLTDNWQSWGLVYARTGGYVYGQRPAIYHKRFTDYYGQFKEKCSAIECEKEYNIRYDTKFGPYIVLALPHPWYTEGESTSEVNIWKK